MCDSGQVAVVCLPCSRGPVSPPILCHSEEAALSGADGEIQGPAPGWQKAEISARGVEMAAPTERK
jgi:hypothetical protein